MKIKRFRAPTIRAALEQVREEQGPDAVILSNQKVANGVEVVAATDYDEALLHQMNGKTTSAKTKPAFLLSTQEENTKSTVEDSVETEYQALRQEFGSLRTLVQSQLSQICWSNVSQDRPEQAALVRSLTGIGLSGDIVASLTKDLEAINDPENAWREALAMFAKRIPLAAKDLLSGGGIYSFVGTTGVGKTTTITKLATRFVLQFDRSQLGLISYEPQDMAAPDQLVKAGNILGVPVQQARGTADLRDTLSQLDSKKLVLIDTPGRSPRDPDFDSPLAGLVDPKNRIRTILTLSGNTQEGFQRETIERYKHIELEGTVISKLDETTNLAGLLSLLIQRNLRMCYLTEGQDLSAGIRSAHNYRAGIVRRAVLLAKRFSEKPSVRPEPIITPAKPSLARA